MIKNISLILLIMYNCLSALSQVTGKIVDKTNFALEYATAAIYNQETNELVTGVITDINGVFVFDNLKKGTYYLEASFIGYEVKTIQGITVVSTNKTTDLGTLRLTLGNALNELVIQGERATVINKIDRQVFDADKFKNAQGGSGIDVIRNLPSVSIDGQGEINVRGSSGFVVLLNGKLVYGNASGQESTMVKNK
jgi:iron complex outermembrane receptor protein